MGGVLQGAAVLCICKLACSFLFLPSLAASHSSVSFCCCCLLIFTDFLVTVFLSFLCIFESWLTELTTLGDVIALRFLLFLSHTYGAVLLLTTPLIAVETVSRLLWPLSDVTHRTVSQTVDSDEPSCCTGKVPVETQEESNNPDKDKRLCHVVGYLCCLSVWVTVALSVSWRWKLEEVWSVVCLHTTNSLLRCLPSLLSLMPGAADSYWSMAFLLLLLLLLATSLHQRPRVPAQVETTHIEKRKVNNNCGSCWKELLPVLYPASRPVMSVTEPAQSVDPEKTDSSCNVHTAYFWNSVQMSAHHHGDFVLASPGCLSAERGGLEHERIKTGTPLIFIMREHVDSQPRSQCSWRLWGFPCVGVNVIIGFVGVLSIVVLPLNLSVNILLVRTIETLMELCLKSLVSSASNTIHISAFRNETLV
ncbi:uncharacterized protein [Channa argus]|uniref:uncharacterized protein n=1 Tax=Channa argus TaxID=215402 RepID=UPI002945C8FD|nr:hypothetical protein Q8A73_005799 [Channa argus]